jgi:hypothetical protein
LILVSHAITSKIKKLLKNILMNNNYPVKKEHKFMYKSLRNLVREWLFKSHCTSWSMETTCRQSRMWLKKPNPGLTRYLLRLPRLPRSKLRILLGLITGHCPLNKRLHNMGLIDEPICIACGMEDESTFNFLCNCQSLISLRMRLLSKPIRER